MGAMEEEIQPIISKIENLEKITYANNIFYKGNYNSHELVVAYSKIGKTFSAMTATLMIERFKCESIIFSGVAGGINPALKIGDIVIGNQLCQHDFDITAFGREPGFITSHGIFSNSDYKLIEIAKTASNNLEINIIEGIIATGDQFISNEEKKSWIRETFNADALEMEGASVALVCDNLQIPFLIIRSISDTAGEDANISFDEFLVTAAKNSSNLILGILDNL